MEVDVQEVCPTCGGKGRVQPSILFTDTLDEQIELYNHHFGRGLKLFVHPFVFAYANKGMFFRSLRFRWFYQYGVRLRADESLPLLEFRFVDRDGETVQLPRMTEESTDKKAEKKAKLYTAKAIEEKPEVVLPKEQAPVENVADSEPAESVAEQPEAAPAAPAKAKRKRSRKKKTSTSIDDENLQNEGVSSLLPSQADAEAEAEIAAKEKAPEAEAKKRPAKAEKKTKKKSAKAAEQQEDTLLENAVELGNGAPQPEAETAKKRKAKKSKRPKANGDAVQSNPQANAAQDNPSDLLLPAPAEAFISDGPAASDNSVTNEAASKTDSPAKRKQGKRVRKSRAQSAASNAEVDNASAEQQAAPIAVSDKADAAQSATKKARSKKSAPKKTKQSPSEPSQAASLQNASERHLSDANPEQASEEKAVAADAKPKKKRSTRKPKSKAEPANEGSADAAPQDTATNNP